MQSEAIEDLRFEQAARAARSERANSPRYLVLLSGFLFVLAVLFLVVQIRDRAAAEERVERERRTAQRAVELSTRLAGLKEQARTAGPDVGAMDTGPMLFTRLETIAQVAGIREAIALPRTIVGATIPGARQTKYEYTLRGEAVEPMLRFVQQATQQVKGLEVVRLEVTPEATGWKVTAVFSRWERTEGA